jgi:inorganic triphosphatase YgiF
MNDPVEIEAKFDFDPADRDRLLAVKGIGRFLVVERDDFVQEDTYHDTADARLAAAGATLRVRRQGNGTKMTFKGPRQASGSPNDAHIASRLEDEVKLDAAQSETMSPDGPLPDREDISPLNRARELVGSGALIPTARIRNARTILTLSDGSITLELAIDDCVGTRLSDGRKVTFGEVELETTAGDRKAISDAAEALQEQIASLRPSPLTKLGRTLD